ncbi:MAG: CoA transferase subunit A [Candidatus Hydrothermae bacterium]|nr:CoA transferase subunit A [Candidatus Hydrothermae bacterium]
MTKSIPILEEGQGSLWSPPDPDAFRTWVREHKSRAMQDKLMTEQEAIRRFVQDGDYVAVELYGTVRAPLSLVRELVRQGKRHLRVAGQGLLEVDFLLAAGLVDALDLTYVGYEVLGLSAILRRAVEGGQVQVTEWSNGALTWRFKAAAMGVPFLPVRSMLGSDTLRHSAAKVVKDPWTGKPVALLPALFPDVALIHVHRADPYGNCQIDGIVGFALELARASKRVIVSAEEIVSPDEIRREPERTVIPYFLVDAVVHAPFGSHPGEMAYLYERDETHLRMFLEKSRTEEGTRAYLEEWIYGVPNHEAYVQKVGLEHLWSLQRARTGR